MGIKQERAISILKEAAATFLNLQSDKSSMITITDCFLSSDGKHVTFYISVFPTEAETPAINFAKRQRSEMREYLKNHTKVGIIPLLISR